MGRTVNGASRSLEKPRRADLRTAVRAGALPYTRRVPGMRSRSRLPVALAALGLAAALQATAQDLEPRAYSASPLGTNFLGIVYGDTRGGVLFDPSVPITDVSARLNAVAVGYGRTYGLWGRQGLVSVLVPWAWGDVEGLVAEEARRVTRSGLTDARLRVSLNLLGSPALSRQEFAKTPHGTILGVSLTVQAPTGEYDGTKLINLGTNRWAFKPEIGVSVPAGNWFLDAYLGAWFFTNNESFYPGGVTRRQDPLVSAQTHAGYTFTSKAWLAFDATWYGGGSATSDGGPPSERQDNTRFGATLAIPIAPGQSIKVAASTGVTTRVGTDFDSVLVAWQLLWFDTPRPQP